MSKIHLIEASEQYSNQLEQFKNEVLQTDFGDDSIFAGCLGLEESPSALAWIKDCHLRKDAATCQQTGTDVPSTVYFAIREHDDKLVGVIDLRHHINHPILGTWGGHIGYTVRPSDRGHNYAREMLRLNISNARAMGISKLLLTCNVTNKASEKAILGNGGELENIIKANGKSMKRYWIETDVNS